MRRIILPVAAMALLGAAASAQQPAPRPAPGPGAPVAAAQTPNLVVYKSPT
jgi:hypothetical protein